jgi:hypothetical protein
LRLRLTRIGQVRDLSDWPTVVETKKTPLHPLTTQRFLKIGLCKLLARILGLLHKVRSLAGEAYIIRLFDSVTGVGRRDATRTGDLAEPEDRAWRVVGRSPGISPIKSVAEGRLGRLVDAAFEV